MFILLGILREIIMKSYDNSRLGWLYVAADHLYNINCLGS